MVYNAKRTCRVAAVLAILVLSTATGSAANHGLFIGTSRYESSQKCDDLPSTRFDANDIQKTMVTTGMLKGEHAKLLIRKNTKQQILDAVIQQGKDMKPGDVLYIFNASHGGGAIQAYDGPIMPKDMAAAIAKSSCGTVVIMNDSCQSKKFVVSVPGKKICHINATSASLNAYHSKTSLPELGHINGVFTKQLISGLNGAADADGNDLITSKELTTWIQKKVKETEPTHHPGNYQEPNMVGDDVELTQKDPNNGWQGQSLVPNVVRLLRAEAEALIRLHGLKPLVKDFIFTETVYFLESDRAKVMKQIPKFNMMAVPGSSVEIHCLPSTVITVPPATGIPVVDARRKLIAVGLRPLLDTAGNITEGYVVKLHPCAGTRILTSSYVFMKRGDKGLTEVPDLDGMTQAEASSMLAAANLKGTFVPVVPKSWYSSFTEPGTVAGKVHDQSPDNNTIVATGTVVNVSIAPSQLVNAPDIHGLSRVEAKKAVEAAGFIFYENRDWRCATSQSPRGVFRYWSPVFPGQEVCVGIEYPMVPGIVGMKEPEAETACKLAKLRFRAEQKDAPQGSASNRVFRQSKRAGTWAIQETEILGDIPEVVTTNNAATNAIVAAPASSGIVQDGKNAKEFREWLIKQLSIPADMNRGDTDSWPRFPALPFSASTEVCGCTDWTVGSKRPKDHPRIEGWCNAYFGSPSSKNGSHSINIGILRYGSTNEAAKACQWFSDSVRLNKGTAAVNMREQKKQTDMCAKLKAHKGDENRNAPLGTPMPADWTATSQSLVGSWDELTFSSKKHWSQSTISSKVVEVLKTSTSKVINFRDYNMKWSTTIGSTIEQNHQKQATFQIGRHVVMLSIYCARGQTQQNSGRNSSQSMQAYPFPATLYNTLETELLDL